MYKDALRPAWVEIDVAALRHNVDIIRKKVGPQSSITGIIKADAYGHGALRVAQVLREEGITSFGVATLSEAVSLRQGGITEDIVLLGLTPDFYVDTLVDYDLTSVICDSGNAQTLSQAAQKAGKTLHVHIAIDTGMGRIGYLVDSDAACQKALEEVQKILALPGLQVDGLFSHLATADTEDKTFALLQESRFVHFWNLLKEAGIVLPQRILANSASVMSLPSTYFETVRPGIVLYGWMPSDEMDPADLPVKPVMSVKAAIVHLKTVPVGYSCGYGRKFIAQRESVIATLTLGYADGYPRPYSSVGTVLVRGHRVPIAGNICMDQVMIDVTDVPGVQLGDEVIIMGSDGTQSITADDIAQATGTINYEICCAFGQRLPKVYLE